MLCALCLELTQLDVGAPWEFIHHSSYSELKKSAEGGCRLCNFLKEALILQFARELPSTGQEAEQYHLAIDLLDRYEKDQDKSKFVASGILANLDPDHSPVEEGCYAFQIVREVPGENAIAIREIYTTVALQAVSGDKLTGPIIGSALQSEPDIELGQQWISICANSHEVCSKAAAYPLPTRVIAVGPADGSEDPSLVIADGRIGRYAALSHSWGGSQPIKLISSTIQPFLERIPFSSLPATFRDAVLVTRQLGLPFLWIDSLCILQDSDEDWARECVRMPGIYGGCQVNIASSSAANCESGFLHPRPRFTICPIEVEWGASAPEQAQKVVLAYYSEDSLLLPEPEQSCYLRNRAWVLQERLISPRTLHFGHAKMYFECLTNVCYENIRCPILDDYETRDQALKLDFLAPKPIGTWLKTWYELVMTYMEADITFPKDRFPALSAIAQEFSKVLQDEYIAGLWRSEFIRGLCWYIESYVTKQRPLDANETYIAPSWSWAGVRTKISYSFNHSTVTFGPQAQITSFSTKPRTSDIFGMVTKNAFVEIEGKVFTANLSPGRHRFVTDRRVWYVESNIGRIKLGQYYSDDVSWNDVELPVQDHRIQRERESEGTAESKELKFFYLGRFKAYKDKALDHTNDLDRALAIEKVEGTETTYRRRGILSGRDWESVLNIASVETIRLI